MEPGGGGGDGGGEVAASLKIAQRSLKPVPGCGYGSLPKAVAGGGKDLEGEEDWGKWHSRNGGGC